MKSVEQYRRWINAKLAWLDAAADFNESDWEQANALLEQARDYAIDLKLSEAAAAASKGPVRQRLVEVFNALPAAAETADTLTPPEIAEQLKVSPDTVLDWIRSNSLKASNMNAPGKRPRYVVTRDDLAEFLKKRQPEPAPARKKRAKPMGDVTEFF